MFSELWKALSEIFQKPVPPVKLPMPANQVGVDTDKFTDVEILARTIYGEARGESELGKMGVAAVIINRAAIGGWWGKTPREVCLARYQFSSWNRNDPNRALLMKPQITDLAYQACYQIAAQAMTGEMADPTDSADSYCVTGLRTSWNANLDPCKVIGKHSYYRTV